MSLRSNGYTVLVGLLLLVGVSLVIGSILGQPILLSYVETGSMSPTLEQGDGFVAIPGQIAGQVDEGDVIVFRAEEVQGGGLTTHRVVGTTDRGFITKGDANPFADQDSEEPPVKEAQVVAVAWQPGGSVFAIPHLGTAVEGIQSVLTTVQRHLAALLGTGALLGVRGLAYLLFAVTLVWYALGEWRARNSTDERRVVTREEGTSPRVIVGLFALLLVSGATAAMVVPAGTQEYGVVSAGFDSERPTVIPTGESNSIELPLGNGGLVPVVVYLEPASEDVDVQPRRVYIAGGQRASATVTLQAPGETGYYRRFVTQHRYLAILPTSTIDSLYRVHPWAPVLVIDALVGIPFYLVGMRLVGKGRVRNRSRNRDLPVVTRLRRLFRQLY